MSGKKVTTAVPPSYPLSVTICGIAELDLHCDVGFGHVISILDPEFPVPPAFEAFDAHDRLELRFHDVIDEASSLGYVAPLREDVSSILQFGRDAVAAGAERILIHCHLGISRSTAAAVMLLAQAEPDREESVVVAEIVRRRPKAWPNLRMIEFADELLGRDGRLVIAVRDRYRSALERQPEILDFIARSGRNREIKGL